MIDDEFRHGARLHRLAALAELSPHAGVQHNDRLGPGETVVAGPETLDALLRVGRGAGLVGQILRGFAVVVQPWRPRVEDHL